MKNLAKSSLHDQEYLLRSGQNQILQVCEAFKDFKIIIRITFNKNILLSNQKCTKKSKSWPFQAIPKFLIANRDHEGKSQEFSLLFWYKNQDQHSKHVDKQLLNF